MSSKNEPQIISQTKATARPGRPPAITHEVMEQLVELVEGGYTIAQACALQGIGESTFYRYSGQFREMRESITRARRSRALRIARLHEEALQVAAATGDWRAVHVQYESELRQLEREIGRGTWLGEIDELIDYVAKAVTDRLNSGHGGHDASGIGSDPEPDDHGDEADAGRAP